MSTKRKQVRLGAHFPGVNNTSVWSDPQAGSHIDFSSFVALAQTAERAKFDLFFLAEGLRMREHAGRLHELDVAGRPDGLTVLAALAAVTERLGLVATITTTYHEPHEVARQLASLDHLSQGRAAWNLVTSSDAFTGANFRRGPYLRYEDATSEAKKFRRRRERDVGLLAGPRQPRRVLRRRLPHQASLPSAASRSRLPATSRCRAPPRDAR